jgi:hypothetical protein
MSRSRQQYGSGGGDRDLISLLNNVESQGGPRRGMAAGSNGFELPSVKSGDGRLRLSVRARRPPADERGVTWRVLTLFPTPASAGTHPPFPRVPRLLRQFGGDDSNEEVAQRISTPDTPQYDPRSTAPTRPAARHVTTSRVEEEDENTDISSPARPTKSPGGGSGKKKSVKKKSSTAGGTSGGGAAKKGSAARAGSASRPRSGSAPRAASPARAGSAKRGTGRK